eukprot:4269572-Pleurochrysis_carterae.AAC.1
MLTPATRQPSISLCGSAQKFGTAREARARVRSHGAKVWHEGEGSGAQERAPRRRVRKALLGYTS